MKRKVFSERQEKPRAEASAKALKTVRTLSSNCGVCPGLALASGKYSAIAEEFLRKRKARRRTECTEDCDHREQQRLKKWLRIP
mmetsp:Transcript_39911/g.105910  ORF Transcript_39911/g.105910 Transcript_39911/m.105910 type:complete len:84 (+) Transcript_39911:1135-1386(+)